MKKRFFTPYHLPAELAPLRAWLIKAGVDVDALKSPRQALFLAIFLSGERMRLPRRREPHFPALMAFQTKLLAKKGDGARRPVPRREKIVRGTFGPASAVRRVSVDAYLADRDHGGQA